MYVLTQTDLRTGKVKFISSGSSLKSGAKWTADEDRALLFDDARDAATSGFYYPLEGTQVEGAGALHEPAFLGFYTPKTVHYYAPGAKKRSHCGESGPGKALYSSERTHITCKGCNALLWAEDSALLAMLNT